MKSHSTSSTEYFEVRFDRFADLPGKKGHDYVDSDFVCFGRRWCLRLWPGGNTNSRQGYVAVFLVHKSAGRIEVESTLHAPTAGFQELRKHTYKEGDPQWGFRDFANRASCNLESGSFVIKVIMKRTDFFLPPNPFGCLEELFLNETYADVAFEMIPEQDSNDALETTEVIRAHRLILQKRSPIFAELLNSQDQCETIQISDVAPEVFRQLLHYMYGGKLAADDMINNAKDLIDAADKYEIVSLKLEAEAALVASIDITVENVIEQLLYSHEKNLALLKETVMDFIVTNRTKVIEKVSFADVPGDLMKDLLVAYDLEEIETVNALRKRSYAKGLEIDGSREALIARLEAGP